MRQFYTSILERSQEFRGVLETHPFEAAWASEGMFFVRIEEAAASEPNLNASVQVSADGVRWIDEGTNFPTMDARGDYFAKVTHFGGWLRLRLTTANDDAPVTVTIHLALKE